MPLESSIRTSYFSDDPNFPSKLIIGTLFIGAFFGYLNETLLNVALTTLMHEFDVPRTTVQWSATGFLLVMGAVTPITASIIQWFSTRTLALTTLAVFLIGTLICALAPSFSWILVGRLVQALSAALTVPLLMNTILAIYPPEKRGAAMGLVTMMFTAAPAIGPTLSGIIVDHFGWRYLFWFTIPFIGLAMLLVATKLKVNINEITRPKIDLLSALLSVLGFGSLIYASSEFANMPLTEFAAILAVSIVLVTWFVRRQFKLETPLLNLGVFSFAQYRYAVILVSLAFFLFLGLELLMPMYTQQILLISGTVTGLLLMPASVAEAILAPVFGTLLDKKGGRAVVLPGAILMFISLATLYFYADESSSTVVLSVIFGVFAVSISTAITGETHGLNALPAELNAHGTAVISTITPIAGALGAAFFVGLSNIGEHLSSQTDRLALLDGIKLAMLVATICALISLWFARKFSNKN